MATNVMMFTTKRPMTDNNETPPRKPKNHSIATAAMQTQIISVFFSTTIVESFFSFRTFCFSSSIIASSNCRSIPTSTAWSLNYRTSAIM